MTTEPTPLVTVLPCDRLAAWQFRPGCYEDDTKTRLKWNAGVYDKVGVIQSHARHRLAALEEAAKHFEALEAALLPFKRALEEWSDEERFPDDRSLWDHPLGMCITIGDFRRAAQAVGSNDETR